MYFFVCFFLFFPILINVFVVVLVGLLLFKHLWNNHCDLKKFLFCVFFFIIIYAGLRLFTDVSNCFSLCFFGVTFFLCLRFYKKLWGSSYIECVCTQGSTLKKNKKTISGVKLCSAHFNDQTKATKTNRHDNLCLRLIIHLCFGRVKLLW